ncbi:hypothetical protein K439DRAFT_1621696 [Ramaria rubella]|nr:hypothetical protein K439DRAFT_1621696 [Ramaria rubella]
MLPWFPLAIFCIGQFAVVTATRRTERIILPIQRDLSVLVSGRQTGACCTDKVLCALRRRGVDVVLQETTATAEVGAAWMGKSAQAVRGALMPPIGFPYSDATDIPQSTSSTESHPSSQTSISINASSQADHWATAVINTTSSVETIHRVTPTSIPTQTALNNSHVSLSTSIVPFISAGSRVPGSGPTNVENEAISEYGTVQKYFILVSTSLSALFLFSDIKYCNVA